jgi:uncharacterized protein YbaR (Trm112 family)
MAVLERAIPESVRRLLVCPVCRGELRWGDADAVTLDGVESVARVECAQCGRAYPLEDGIPILLRERVTRAG